MPISPSLCLSEGVYKLPPTPLRLRICVRFHNMFRPLVRYLPVNVPSSHHIKHSNDAWHGVNSHELSWRVGVRSSRDLSTFMKSWRIAIIVLLCCNMPCLWLCVSPGCVCRATSISVWHRICISNETIWIAPWAWYVAYVCFRDNGMSAQHGLDLCSQPSIHYSMLPMAWKHMNGGLLQW